jgi:preprotein translocase subunit SecE
LGDYGCSSIGRVVVSKTIGWEFESLHPCGFKRIAMKKIKEYILDSYVELRHKVYWPKYSELQASSVLVLVASVIIALIIGVIDLGFDKILTWYYNAF